MATHSGQVPTLVITGAHPQLYNHDLAPTAPEGRTWGAFSLFAMWMSDVHSVGGYTFAASLFFLGLTGWQVLISMLVGITAVYFLMNLDRPPVGALWHSLPGHGPCIVRRDGRQPRGHRARSRRHRLVRRADLFRLESGAGPCRNADPFVGRPHAQQHHGAVHARMVQFPLHVVLSTHHLSERDGAHPQVHRFLRPGRLCRDVRRWRSGCSTRPAFQASRSS